MQRTEDTISLASAMGENPKPESAIDLDAFGLEYLARARRDTALARWAANCPEGLKVTDWEDARLSENRECQQKVMDWIQKSKGLLATGPSGLGKSRAMWALMKRLAEEGREIRYFTAATWFSTLQAQIVYGRDESLGWIKAMAKAPVVFIDDLGQESVQTSKQEWASGWLFQFLDMRLGNQLPLFVTTNLTAKEIAGNTNDTRGNPLVRRLLELCEPVKFETKAKKQTPP